MAPKLADRRGKREGGEEPLSEHQICDARGNGLTHFARLKHKARTGMLLREKLISGHILFPDEGQQGAANGKNSWGFIRDAQAGLWTAGCWLTRRLHQLKAYTTTMDLGISIIHFCMMCGLEKHGLAIQN